MTLKEQLEGSLVLVDKRSAGMEVSAPLNPMQELQMQIVRTGDLEKLKQLREIEREWKADQAKQAFKAEAVKLIRTKEVAAGPLKGTKHVELGEVVRVSSPALSRHGLSIAWRLTRDEKDWMEVTCTLKHEAGHFETVSMGGPPDVGPGRNAIQARGSAKTYLERYTATAILGLAPESDNDGAGVTPASIDPEACLEEGVASDFVSLIEGSGSIDELQKNYLAARDAAQKAGDVNAGRIFGEVKNKVYKQLAKG